MKLKTARNIILTASVALLFTVSTVGAQGLKNAGNKLDTVSQKAGVEDFKNVENVVGVTLNALLGLLGLIFFILMVYAGFLWMGARGEEDKIQKAQKIIASALIGLFIVVAAYAITTLVGSRLS